MLRSKLLPAGCALALTLPACVDNDTSLFVEGVLAASPPECEVTGEPGSAHILRGTMDVGFTTKYEAALLVGLQLAPRGDKSKLRTESMIFQTRGAEVRLTNSVGDLVDEFSVPAGGATAPTSAEAPGFGTVAVVLVPNDIGSELRADLGYGERRTLVAEVRVFGDTLGGAELTSGSFTFVIDVCDGCLSRAIEDGWSYDEVADQYYCNTMLSEPIAQNGCLIGQDGTFDCRLCETDDCFLRPW